MCSKVHPPNVASLWHKNDKLSSQGFEYIIFENENISIFNYKKVFIEKINCKKVEQYEDYV